MLSKALALDSLELSVHGSALQTKFNLLTKRGQAVLGIMALCNVFAKPYFTASKQQGFVSAAYLSLSYAYTPVA